MRKSRGKGKGITFIDSVVQSGTDECVIWPYYITPQGYGQIGLHSGMHLVHRYVCTITHGEAPSDKPQAGHICGTKACVNPKHIRWVSQTENENDKHSHGTWYDRVSNGKLSVDEVRTMRQLYDAGTPSGVISDIMNVPKSTVVKVVRRYTWKHVD